MVYGFSVMEMTGLPSGTVYPAMRRLERDELIRSQLGAAGDRGCRADGRRESITSSRRSGKATLEASRRRYPLLVKLIPSEQEEQV